MKIIECSRLLFNVGLIIVSFVKLPQVTPDKNYWAARLLQEYVGT